MTFFFLLLRVLLLLWFFIFFLALPLFPSGLHQFWSIWKVVIIEVCHVYSFFFHHHNVLSNHFWIVKLGEQREVVNNLSFLQNLLLSFWSRINYDSLQNAHILQILGVQNISHRSFQIFSKPCFFQKGHKAIFHEDVRKKATERDVVWYLLSFISSGS